MWRVYPLGDKAWNIDLGEDRSAPDFVLGLNARINKLRERGLLPAITECQPTMAELCVHYDPEHPEAPDLQRVLQRLCKDVRPQLNSGAALRLPVCFASEYASDIDDVAQSARLTPERVQELMLGSALRVFTLGFLPGFAYMGSVPKALRLPRLATPRRQIPAGSLAIAESMVAVYPFASPGGWRIIGRCPELMFDSRRDLPSLLNPGDSVRLEAISKEKYQQLRSTTLD